MLNIDYDKIFKKQLNLMYNLIKKNLKDMFSQIF